MANIAQYAKAIVALVVVAASVFLGPEISDEIDIEALEAAIITVITAASVFFVPNKRKQPVELEPTEHGPPPRPKTVA